MKKNMLKEQYARLFKGRPSSNDAKLINEAAIKVTDHGTNWRDKLVVRLEANGKKFWVVTGDTDWMEWEYYQKTGMHEPDEKVSPSRIARQDPKDVFRACEKLNFCFIKIIVSRIILVINPLIIAKIIIPITAKGIFVN